DMGRGGAGGHQLGTAFDQCPRQVVEAVLVIDGQQCPLDRLHVGAAHGMVTFRPLMVQPSRTIRPTTSTSWTRSAALIRSVSVSSVSSSRTGTATWAMIGPVSTPLSTKKSVAPATFTPAANASRGPCMPANDGSSELWVLM